MPNADIIRKRLDALERYTAILRKLSRYSLQEFVDDPEHYGSAERFLQLSVEALSDLGNYVVADLHLGEVNSYADIPDALARAGIVSSEQRAIWIRMIGFRNILVHDYLQVDRTIVYAVLRDRLQDIQDIGRVFAQFL